MAIYPESYIIFRQDLISVLREGKMKTKKLWVLPVVFIAFLSLVLISRNTGTAAVKEGQKIYIMDQTGERWDISQAVSIGFDPDHFEFGIGRNAFTPLGETNWKPGPADKHAQIRVIGVTGKDEAHAYSVAKLRYHETANTFLDSKAIVAGY
jgi:hypothetical protein